MRRSMRFCSACRTTCDARAAPGLAREPGAAPALGLVLAALRRCRRSGVDLRSARRALDHERHDRAGRRRAGALDAAAESRRAECAEVFAWLRQQGLLTAALAENRTRAALAADNPRLAREFAADVPVDRRAALLQWSDLLESPQLRAECFGDSPCVDGRAGGVGRRLREACTHRAGARPGLAAHTAGTGWLDAGAARIDSSALPRSAPRTTAIRARLPRSMICRPEAVDAQVQEWRVRAALWSGDFARALAWIEQMPPSPGDAAALALLARARHCRDRGRCSGRAAVQRNRRPARLLRLSRGGPHAQPYNLNVRPSPVDTAAQTALSKGGDDSRARIVRLRHGG